MKMDRSRRKTTIGSPLEIELSRRQVLLGAVAVAAATSLNGCERTISAVSKRLGAGVPQATAMPVDSSVIDPACHLLNRAGFGPWPGDLARVREIGQQAWIEEQLSPQLLDDTACEIRARRFESIHLSPGLCYEFKKPVLRDELVRHALLRAVYSRRQLYESMVAFWSDHLNINMEKGDCIYLKGTDDREVIRVHALGNFRDLIKASATSGAMLVYLDGKDNKKTKPSDIPNENYARELLELHTMGVDGGYTQHDVSEVARCLTGWTLRGRWRRGEVTFDPARHDDAAKIVLGKQIPAGGAEKDLDAVVDLITAHPSTARHIAFKLCRWFVSDQPSPDLVSRTAATFSSSGGDIKSTVRFLLASSEFSDPINRGSKIKTPVRFVASALRVLGADTHAHAPLTGFLERMGQAMFQYPTPEGYSPEPTHVLGTLLWRWNFAFALASGSLETVKVDLPSLWNSIRKGGASAQTSAHGALDSGSQLGRYLLGRAPSDQELAAVGEFDRTGNEISGTLAALWLASPGFQRY
jgi:hypothetical protein